MASIDAIQNDWVAKVFEKASQIAFGNNLITNNLRGLIAETIISFALEPNWIWVSADYTGWDFERRDGLRLEVKQSALLQTWNSVDNLSKPVFDIAARTGYNDSSSSAYVIKSGRPAHIYVFAHHTDTSSQVDHRDPAQWVFYVIATSLLPNQKTISLNPLKSLCKAVRFDELSKRVDEVAKATMPLERA